MNKFFILSVLVMLLAGCAASPPLPQDHIYVFSAPKEPGDGIVSLPGKTVAVAAFKSAGLYSERPILFRNNLQPNELQQYHYHYWSMPPGQAMQEVLIAALRVQAPDALVTDASVASVADLQIGGKIWNFEQREQGDSQREQGINQSVHVKIEFEVKHPQSIKPIFLRTYELDKRQAESGVESAVATFDIAVQEIMENFLRDLPLLLNGSSMVK